MPQRQSNPDLEDIDIRYRVSRDDLPGESVDDPTSAQELRGASEHSVRQSHWAEDSSGRRDRSGLGDEVPGVPERRTLTAVPEELGRRFLEDATEAPLSVRSSEATALDEEGLTIIGEEMEPDDLPNEEMPPDRVWSSPLTTELDDGTDQGTELSEKSRRLLEQRRRHSNKKSN